MTNSSMPLVLAGGKGWLMDEFAAEDVLLTGYVTDEELAWLYRNCFAFLYPSLFEGFGMPVLEALTLGAPVICSNTTSLPEVAGDAALLVDPLDAPAIAAAMQRLASGEVSREALKQKGEIQSRRFSWQQSAARLRDVVRTGGAKPLLASLTHVQRARARCARGSGVPDRLSRSIRQNQPGLCLSHAENVLELQEMRQLGCFFRSQPQLSFALNEFSNTLLSFGGGAEIHDVFRSRSTRYEGHQFEIDWIACVHSTSLNNSTLLSL